MRYLGLTALFVFTSACDRSPEPPKTSAEVPSSAISLDVELHSNGGLAQIVVMVIEEYSILTLSGGDRLLFGPLGDPTHVLTRFDSEKNVSEDGSKTVGISAYVAELETDAADFELTLSRSGGARFTSSFTLPPPFALSVPTTPVSRAEPIPISWEKSSGPYQTWLEIAGPCLPQGLLHGFDVDPGAFDAKLSDFVFVEGTVDCDLQATVTRSGRDARFAPELRPPKNLAELEQIRFATFATVP